LATDKRGVFVREATDLVKEFSLEEAIYVG
jgi:hypothetical protein